MIRVSSDPLGVKSWPGLTLWGVKASCAVAVVAVEVNRLGYGGRLFSARWEGGTDHDLKWTLFDGFQLSFRTGLAILFVLFVTGLTNMLLVRVHAAVIDGALFLATAGWAFNLFLGMGLGFA